MRDALLVSALSVLPRRRVASGLGAVARTTASRWLCRAFVAAYGVDLAEAADADFPSLDALFSRRLRPGARPVDPAAGALVSPADGVCAFAGRSVGGRVAVAPGRDVALDDILGERLAGERDVVVVYLSPRDYHRVHAPVGGRLLRWRYVAGDAWPVSAGAVRRVPRLYARNERLVFALDSGVHVALIGAFGVGRITTPFAEVVTAASGAGDQDRAVAAGDELGAFHLGSTVIVAMPVEGFALSVTAGDRVRACARVGGAIV